MDTLSSFIAKKDPLTKEEVLRASKMIRDIHPDTTEKQNALTSTFRKLLRAHPMDFLTFEDDFGGNFFSLIVKGGSLFLILDLFFEMYWSGTFYNKNVFGTNTIMLIVQTLSRQASRGGKRTSVKKREDANEKMDRIMSILLSEKRERDLNDIVEVWRNRSIPKS